ncbi:MAG: hypothetical protein NT007_08740 [Candidatus Kapabacteria bacterium]|nr:hypothetical protein [Candidatus Kapabacteria bacterium]
MIKTFFDNLIYFFILCVIILFVSCKTDNPISATEDILSEHISSTHFEYFYSKSDNSPIDTAWQEKYYSWLISELNVTLVNKLEFFKYRDIDHLERVTGKRTNGFAEMGTYKFNTIWTIDNHECVHSVVVNLIGHPPALFNEGIAVAHQALPVDKKFVPGWNGQDFNLLAKNFKKNGELPPLDDLLGYLSFWNYNSNLTYSVSGSFVRYIINQYGIQKLKDFYKTVRFETPKDSTKLQFKKIYNFTLDSAWQEWNNFISKY